MTFAITSREEATPINMRKSSSMCVPHGAVIRITVLVIVMHRRRCADEEGIPVL